MMTDLKELCVCPCCCGHLDRTAQQRRDCTCRVSLLVLYEQMDEARTKYEHASMNLIGSLAREARTP